MKLISLFLLLSCASIGDKKTYRDVVRFSGGRFQDVTWNDKLLFNRVSWFSQASMEFDIYLAQIDKNSGFKNWFTGSEQKYLSECEDIFISLSTSNFSKVLTDSAYVNEMKKNDLVEVMVPNFTKHLKLHPEFVQWNMTMYRPRLFCSKNNIEKISINFPSFETISINL